MKSQIFQIEKSVYWAYFDSRPSGDPTTTTTQRDMKSVKNITKSTSLIPQFRPTLLLLPPCPWPNGFEKHYYMYIRCM